MSTTRTVWSPRLVAAALAASSLVAAGALVVLAGCLGPAPTPLETSSGNPMDATVHDGSGGATVDGPLAEATTLEAGVEKDTGAALATDAGGAADVVTCTPSGTCVPDQCQVGIVICEAGALACELTGNSLGGTSCDAGVEGGAVCNNGMCNPCASGTDCTPSGSCQKMTIACTTGVSVCVKAGLVTDGTPCGPSQYCDNGNCAACASSVDCQPSGNPCDQGTTSCSNGQLYCTDTGMAAANGTSCGTNMVCSNAACVACTAGVSCSPTNPCHVGQTSCASGTSMCVDTGVSVANDTPCTGSNLCLTTYSCQAGFCTGSNPVVCPSAPMCYSAGTCNTGTGLCGAQQPKTSGTSCNDGNLCTQTDTCNGSGSCVGSNPVVCSGTAPVCETAPTCAPGTGLCGSTVLSNGAPCGGSSSNMTCSSGSCSCPSSLPTTCSSTCVDTTSDPKNCGSCGHNCLGSSCQSSECKPTLIGATPGMQGEGIAVGPSAVFFTDGSGGNVYTCPLSGCPSAGPTVYFSGLEFAANLYFDSTNQYVYVSGDHHRLDLRLLGRIDRDRGGKQDGRLGGDAPVGRRNRHARSLGRHDERVDLGSYADRGHRMQPRGVELVQRGLVERAGSVWPQRARWRSVSLHDDGNPGVPQRHQLLQHDDDRLRPDAGDDERRARPLFRGKR